MVNLAWEDDGPQGQPGHGGEEITASARSETITQPRDLKYAGSKLHEVLSVIAFYL
jgi:hypothetical protein